MFQPTQLTVKRKRGMLVVGFRSPRIQGDTLIAIIGRELLEICDIHPGSERCILLDFRGVELLSSAFIGKIVLLNRKAKARRIAIRIGNLGPEPMRVFEVMQLDKVFSIVDYEEDDDDDDDEEIGTILRAFCVRRSLGRSRESEGERDGFRFAPELFEVRTDVIAELSNRGFDWLSHYSAVDPMHDVYGIEVCGIHRKEDASAILSILIEMFPDWRPG